MAKKKTEAAVSDIQVILRTVRDEGYDMTNQRNVAAYIGGSNHLGAIVNGMTPDEYAAEIANLDEVKAESKTVAEGGFVTSEGFITANGMGYITTDPVNPVESVTTISTAINVPEVEPPVQNGPEVDNNSK